MINCFLKFISKLAITLLVPQLVFGSDLFKPHIQNQGKYISNTTQGKNRHLLYGHVPADVKHAFQQQAMDKNEVLKLSIVLSLNNEEELNEKLLSISDPLRPDYQQFLSQSEFINKYAPTPEQVDKTKTYLENNGMHVEAIAPNRLIIRASASVGTIEKIFNTKIYHYTDKLGKTFYAPAYELQIDNNVPILSVLGLENRIKMRSYYKQLKSVQSSASAGPTQGLTPANIKKAYSISSNLNGAGQTLALFQLDGYTASDITAYEDAFNLPHVPLQNILVDGASGIPSSSRGPGEVTLDIELMIAMAPGASKILVYEGPNTSAGVVDTYNKIATDNLAKSISTSWGIDEISGSGPGIQAQNAIFKQMVAQGQAIFAASGDLGAYDNGQTLLADDPSSQPFVVGVGGTRLSTNTNGSYLSETTWSSGSGPGGQGGGGGISSLWTIPSWQKAVISSASLGSSTMRNSPDVSLDADPNSGYAIFYEGSWSVFGGTSCAAPLWSAFFALVNQERSINGQGPMGFPNPTLYALGQSADYPLTFHDIADNSTNLYYPAVKGYDLATGWGTFIGDALITYLAGGINPPQTCIQANPTVTISPSFQQSPAGGVLLYTVTVTNNDNLACSASNFNVTATVPGGFTNSLSQNSLTLSPGSSGVASVNVTSGLSSTFGNYLFSVNAKNMGAPSYQGTGSATYGVTQARSQLTLAMTPQFAVFPYNSRQYASFNFTLMNGINPIPNVLINLMIKGPKFSWGTYLRTGFNGSVPYYLFLNQSLFVGNYQVTAVALYNGNSATAQGSFIIQ